MLSLAISLCLFACLRAALVRLLWDYIRLAFESTIATHGLPAEDGLNFRLPRELEALARSKGVVPATIAVLAGRIHVGLTGKELQELLDPASEPLKLSRRDLAYAITKKRYGGTTVASTMYIAHLAGVRSQFSWR